VGGAHGGEDGFDVSCVLVLRLVQHQQVVGRLAAAGRAGVAADKDDRSPAQRIAARVAAAPPPAARPRRVEPLLQPAHAPPQPVAHRPVDHLPAAPLEKGEQVDEQLCHGFVLARLARKDEQEFAPAAVDDGIDHRPQRRNLVRPQRHADDQPREALDVGQYVGSGVKSRNHRLHRFHRLKRRTDRERRTKIFYPQIWREERNHRLHRFLRLKRRTWSEQRT